MVCTQGLSSYAEFVCQWVWNWWEVTVVNVHLRVCGQCSDVVGCIQPLNTCTTYHICLSFGTMEEEYQGATDWPPPQYSPGMKTIRMLCVSVVVEHMSRMRSVTAMWQWQHCHLVDIVSTVHNSPTMFKVCIFSSYRIIQCRRINFVLPGWATSQHHTTVKCFYL